MAKKKKASKTVETSAKTEVLEQKKTEPAYECLSSESNLIGCVSNNSYYYNLYSSDIFRQYNRGAIEAMIKDPIHNNRALRDLSRMLYSSNGVYTNVVDYLESMPTLDYLINVTGRVDSTKAKYKSLIESALIQLRHKEFVRDMLHRGMIDGIAFYYCETQAMPESNRKFYGEWEMPDVLYEMNDLGVNLTLIPLPVNYTKIHHTTNGVYTLAFDLRYFCNGAGGTEEAKLLTMPQEIREKYRLWRDNNLEDDDQGCWAILDWRKTLTLKIRSDKREPWGRPLCLSAIQEMLYAGYFVDTKRNILNNINNEVWIQTFPEGAQKGQTTLTKKQQEEQHRTVSNALKNKDGKQDRTVISVQAGTAIDHVEATNTELLEDTYEDDLDNKIAMYLGIAGSLLNGSGSGSYSAQQDNLKLVSMQLFGWIEQVQNELNKVLNNALITKRGYKCEVVYLGITFANRSEVVGNFKELYTLGKGSIQAWVAATGMRPDVFFNLIDEEKKMGWDDLEKFPVHSTSYNSAGDAEENPDESQAGRPVEENPTDSTVKYQSFGGNDIPRPSQE